MHASTTQHARFRFRSESLKIEETANTVKNSLLKTKGVATVAINKRVGSLLVYFDQTKVKAEKLFGTIASKLGIDVAEVKNKLSSFHRSISGRQGRKVVKRGLMGAGAASLGLLAFSEKGHAIACGVWLSLLAIHLYQNKRTLLT